MMKHRTLHHVRILVALAVFQSVLLGFFMLQSLEKRMFGLAAVERRDFSELKELEGANLSFSQLSVFFSNLAETNGAVYALEALKRAPIPPNTDMHLLGHVVGDVLYRQEGIDGIQYCTEDFRNACSHSIVVGAFLEKGEGILSEIKDACKKAPGGSGAYTMCFHGFGHGVLAYTLYNMEQAIGVCKKVGTPEYRYREFIECVGGTTMEMIAGVHDREAWQKQVGNYFKKEDPLYPCDAPFMPDEARSVCYVYLTPNFFERAGADLGRPTAENFRDSFPYCNRIPKTQKENRDSCYGGFGKEFVVLAKARDIRNIESMTDNELQTVYSWCSLSDARDGAESCLRHAVNSLYWGGENNISAPIRFCTLMSDASFQSMCFSHLFDQVSFYIQDRTYRDEFCSAIDIPEFQSQCNERL